MGRELRKRWNSFLVEEVRKWRKTNNNDKRIYQTSGAQYNRSPPPGWCPAIQLANLLPFFCSANPLFFVCSEYMHSNFTSQALEVFTWKRFKCSKCDTKVCCSMGLGIKQRRSCRKQLPDSRASRGATGARLAWPRLWAEGMSRRMPRSWRSQLAQSLPTCTDQRLQHHRDKGSLSLSCHFTRSQQQGINPEYFCRIKRKQALLKPLHSLSCQRHFINVLQKHTKSFGLESTTLVHSGFQTRIFPKWSFLCMQILQRERLEETFLIPPLFHVSSGWLSLIPNATSTSVSTEANEYYLQSSFIILSAAPLFHLEAPGQGTSSAWSLVSAFTLAGPQQEAHEQRSSEMEITHELLMQIRRGQSK